MAVEFQDFSFQVKAALNDVTRAWLHETANNIASDAKENCKMRTEEGTQGANLADSYRADVNEGAGSADIGTSLEAGYWEEFG